MARPAGHPDNTLISRLGNHVKWAAIEDRTAATQPARDAMRDKFLEEARAKFGDLPEQELARRAESLRKAHFTRLALKSAQARRKRAGRPSSTEREAA
jgi:hypothetical protein